MWPPVVFGFLNVFTLRVRNILRIYLLPSSTQIHSESHYYYSLDKSHSICLLMRFK